MDPEREKRESRITERETERSNRDRNKDHHHHRDQDHHRDQKHHRSRDDRDQEREDHKSRVLGSRHRSRDSPQDAVDPPKRDRSHDRYAEKESSRKRKDYGGENDERHEKESSRKRKGYGGENDERHDRYAEKESSRKTKDYGGENDERLEKTEKRSRVLEEKREKRRFEDRVLDDSRDLNGTERREKRRFEDRPKEEDAREKRKIEDRSKEEGRREKRRFEDPPKEEEETRDLSVKWEKKIVVDDDEQLDNAQSSAMDSKRSSFVANGSALEPLSVASRDMPETASSSTHHPNSTKVSSISTTNENKGVSVTRSHEVPGKSSTDGTTSAAGKSGSFSLDALAKAKKALQMQKELSEKLSKIPLLNTPSSNGGVKLGVNKDGPKASSSSTGTHYGSSAPATASLGTISGTSTLPVVNAAPLKPPPAGGIAALTGLTNVPNYEAVKRAQELAAKMGFHQDPEFAPLINMFPGHLPVDATVPQKPAKAPVLRLDAQGREIDENGNVINIPKPTNLSTLKVNINKQKKEAFQILRPDLDADMESNPHFDERMGINKTKILRPKRMSIQFVEEGKWSKQAEIIRFKSQFGEAQAIELKTKQAQLAKAKAELDINPNLIEVSERVITKEKPKDPIPEVEWWDVQLLSSGTYGEITTDNIAEKLKVDKITIYVEHPLPIEPPAEPAPPPPQPLKLTKKEQKKLRTQRRLAKEKDRQEMIRQGLVDPPKPKIKMSNLMKVLGSEATQDPTMLEMEIRSAAAEREQAHVDRNIARKLTPAERREKKERKLFDDPNIVETIVSVYKINDLSHPQTRFKVDVNAQENRLTGCGVISDGVSVVVVEGGSKPIKRYGKLMLRRINWAAAVVNEEDGGVENADVPVNKCELVWQGSVAKPSFNRFLIHQCRTDAAARKVFSDAGVAHYWDLAVNFTNDQI